jgi:hypothetical protein
MSYEFNDGEFEDLVKGFRGGQVTTLIRYRAGGHTGSDWGYPGDTARSGLGAMLLVGSGKWTGFAATSGALELPLPAKFAGTPVVVAVPVLTVPAFEDVRLLVAPDTYQLTVYWHSTNNLTELWINWLAAGLPVVG